MRRLRVLGALVAAIMVSRQRCTSATGGQQQPEGLLGPAEAEEVERNSGRRGDRRAECGTRSAGDPGLEQLGDAGKEAFGPGAELRGQVAGEDGRQLVGVIQDDQVAIVGRSLRDVAHEYRALKGGDKLSAGNAEVLFIFIRLGRR